MEIARRGRVPSQESSRLFNVSKSGQIPLDTVHLVIKPNAPALFSLSTVLFYTATNLRCSISPLTATSSRAASCRSSTAKDEAVRLVSNHPGLRAGPCEIRPVEDMAEVVGSSQRGR